MEIIQMLHKTRGFYQFKIDLIVWKLNIRFICHFNQNMFKIDLIVWKSWTDFINEIKAYSLK